MIGWEYPPHNSGGLGVACEGMTQALAHRQTKIDFTLPYQHAGNTSHMNLLSCVDPSWEAVSGSNKNQPPFAAYASGQPVPTKNFTALDRHQLQTLPQSELEQKVTEYADVVTAAGMNHKREFDIIHAHDWMSFAAARKLANKTKKPMIAHVHSTEFDRIPSGHGSPYIMQAEYEGMEVASKVIAVSAYTKQLLVDKYSIDPHKIAVVHNGVSALATPPDPGTHHFAPSRPVIVFMGRLTMQKGADYFLKLARAVLKQLPNALFVVAGSGDMYHELLFKTAYDQLSANVVFSGFVRDTQKERLLNRADVFVMPSLSEPFGLVAVEAAQRHTPVIVSKNAGVSEVMPGSIRADFWDIEHMAHQIVALVRDEKFSIQVREQQLADLEQVTWDKSAQKIIDLYRKTFLGK